MAKKTQPAQADVPDLNAAALPGPHPEGGSGDLDRENLPRPAGHGDVTPDQDLFDAEYLAARAAFRENLSAPRAAMLDIAESLLRLEDDFPFMAEYAGCTLNVEWRYGMTTAEMLGEAVYGGENLLPDPGADRTDAFGLQFIPRQPCDQTKRQAEMERLGGYHEFKEQYGARGSQELRVFDTYVEGIPVVKLHYNIGEAKGMEGLLHKVFDRVDYPVLVSDKYGFRFENAALRNALGNA